MFLSIGSGTGCIIISNGWKTEATHTDDRKQTSEQYGTLQEGQVYLAN